MKSLIIYNSQHGKTQMLANDIGQKMSKKDYEVKTISISEFTESDLQGVDILLLGSWTKGLFLFAQQPDVTWKEFASKLPELGSMKIGLFTTYGIATGSMFRKMAKCLNKKLSSIQFTIKSKTGFLSQSDLSMLNLKI